GVRDGEVDVARVVAAPVSAARMTLVIGLAAAARPDEDVEVVLPHAETFALRGGHTADEDLERAGQHDGGEASEPQDRAFLEGVHPCASGRRRDGDLVTGRKAELARRTAAVEVLAPDVAVHLEGTGGR